MISPEPFGAMLSSNIHLLARWMKSTCKAVLGMGRFTGSRSFESPDYASRVASMW
jgi:hypothetical protein